MKRQSEESGAESKKPNDPSPTITALDASPEQAASTLTNSAQDLMPFACANSAATAGIHVIQPAGATVSLQLSQLH